VAKVTVAVMAAVVDVVKAPPVAAAVVAKVAWVVAVDVVKVAAPVVLAAVPADLVAASVNISVKRRSASFVSRRWISSTTSALTFFRSSCRSAARFCLGA
jgi:hypothetical protein